MSKKKFGSNLPEGVEPDGIDQLLMSRDVDYGEAWNITGTVIQDLPLNKVVMSGYFYAWIQIMGKLIRLLASPHHHDSWVDIEGYARLVSNHIQTKEQVND